MPYPEKREGKLTGHWYAEVDLRHKGGPRMRERFETKRQAEGWEAYVKATGERPPWAQDGASGHTFAGVAKDCKAEHPPWQRGKDPTALQRLEFVCEHTKLGKLPIESISRGHLQDVVNSLRRRAGKGGKDGPGVASGTINRYLSAISVVIKFAASDPTRYGKIARPVFPWQDKGEQREETISPEQETALVRLIAKTHPQEAFLVSVLAATGMRAGELLRLKPEQIEHERIRLKAANNKTKTARLVYIGPEIARQLRATVASGSLPDRKQLWQVFKDAVRACGYNEELTLHSLRHTRATRLMEAGVDAQITMQMLGWRSFSTMARYRHVNDDMQREAAEKVSHRRGETPDTSDVLQFPITAKSNT